MGETQKDLTDDSVSQFAKDVDNFLFIEGLAQQNCGRGITVGDVFDIHEHLLKQKIREKQYNNTNLHGYILAQNYRRNPLLTGVPAV